MRLELERDLVFFDLETTGVSIQEHRIIELYAVRLSPDGSRRDLHHYINPGMPIPEEATAIHGITDELVADKPSFAELSDELATFFADADLGGFNVRRFDVPMLMEEFHRCKKYPILLKHVRVIDPYVIFMKKESRNLSAAVRFYCEEEHEEAHAAQADVEATMKVFSMQLERYEDLGQTVEALEAFVADGFKGFIRGQTPSANGFCQACFNGCAALFGRGFIAINHDDMNARTRGDRSNPLAHKASANNAQFFNTI